MNKLKKALDEFRKTYPGERGLSDDALFSALCAKCFFFANPRNGVFSPEAFDIAITDGTNDHGFDALFRNPDPEVAELVVLQCKCYDENNALTVRGVRKEMQKIVDAIDKVRRGVFKGLNPRIRPAFEEALGADSANDVVWRIAFMTSWIPPRAELRRALVEAARSFAVDRISVEMHFGDDIAAEVEDFGSEQEYCPRGELKLFGRDRGLRYGSAARVLNISAVSLAKLVKSKRGSVLGMNLRYHISSRQSDRKVNEGMIRTMRETPDFFWYYNNGIVIVCYDGFTVTSDGRLLMRKFSIVNGGQTTANIASLFETSGLPRDFPVLCKIVKAQGRGEKGKSAFCNDIAEYTNSQKPISAADLRANRDEQKKLQKRLLSEEVFYVRKAGDVPTKKYHSWQIAGMERIGKLGLAGVMLMPAEARNKLPTMFEEGPYAQIFGARVPGRIYADLLLLSRCYQDFRRRIAVQRGRGRWFTDEGEEIVRNGETFVLAAISYVERIQRNTLGRARYKATVKAARAGDRNPVNQLCGKFKGVDGFLSTEVRDRLIVSVRDRDESIDLVFAEICGLLLKAYRKHCNTYGEDVRVSDYLKRADAFHLEMTDFIYRHCRKPYSKLMVNWRKCMI